MPTPAVLRRRLYTAALVAFRRLPAPVRRGLVRAGTPGFTVGAVCAIEHEGRLLFLRQPHRPGWSLPGGLLDRGEDPATGVQRELLEETGLRVRVGLPLATQVNPRVRRVDVIYRLRVDSRPAVAAGGEAQEAAWLRPEEAREGSDAPTLEILDLLERAQRPGSHDGRVLPAP
ncbi:NUDIX hydrolase [Quadrisphaera sp. DSM 44207]|uniref:NUDIX hydrolase n=1 Tax=Quadrisphaera sp. DSM 44207 TaxID=1881057 RepID=UPI00088D1D1A|nr:NUDIX domain-containing protein [Quadrisphaera sp. DSM 44207]SDQ12957.1 ADP-ribose pyrophosphatase YjhB, NUDIX family [Quadrisphaera sp. DSM 44207]